MKCWIFLFRHHVQFDKGARTSPERAWKYEHLQPALKALGLPYRPAGGGGSGEARTSDIFYFFEPMHALVSLRLSYLLASADFQLMKGTT